MVRCLGCLLAAFAIGNDVCEACTDKTLTDGIVREIVEVMLVKHHD